MHQSQVPVLAAPWYYMVPFLSKLPGTYGLVWIRRFWLKNGAYMYI